MAANGSPLRVMFGAALIALSSAAPAALSAQQNDSVEDAGEAAAIAHADSIRAALVQPPGDRHSPASLLARAPFRLFAASVATVGVAGYGFYRLLSHFGAVQAAKDVNRELEAIDIKLRPDFIGNRSGVGMSARWGGSGTPLFLEGGYSLRGYRLARGGVSFGDTLNGLELSAGHHELTQIHFWGIGPDARMEDRSDFAQTRRDVTAAARARVLPHVRVSLAGGWEQDEVGRGEDSGRPDLQDTFEGALPFGAVGAERWAHLNGQVDVDFTAVVQSDRLRGVRALAGWSGYRGVSDTDADFQVGSADLRAYFPVTARHEIALRGLASEVFAESGDGVPFYHLPRLGSTEGLRGMRGWRFRDRAVLAGMAEWRYQVWWHPGDPEYRVDAFVFADHGAVGPSLGDIGRSDFVTTPGIGLRFLEHGIARVEAFLATGGEDLRASVKLRASF